MSNPLERFMNIVTRAARPAAERAEESDEDTRLAEAMERQRLHERQRWASSEMATAEFIPALDAEIERLETEQDRNIDSQAQMILLQGNIRGLKSVRKMFHTWQSYRDAEE